ncbi:hypothetical protein BDW22DRAFT_1420394 [Trametopsis cervina]|nr:hypothetical protein BDW22DRAFT_1420394 [Trametopsis cervina]
MRGNEGAENAYVKVVYGSIRREKGSVGGNSAWESPRDAQLSGEVREGGVQGGESGAGEGTEGKGRGGMVGGGRDEAEGCLLCTGGGGMRMGKRRGGRAKTGESRGRRSQEREGADGDYSRAELSKSRKMGEIREQSPTVTLHRQCNIRHSVSLSRIPTPAVAPSPPHPPAQRTWSHTCPREGKQPTHAHTSIPSPNVPQAPHSVTGQNAEDDLQSLLNLVSCTAVCCVWPARNQQPAGSRASSFPPLARAARAIQFIAFASVDALMHNAKAPMSAEARTLIDHGMHCNLRIDTDHLLRRKIYQAFHASP